MRFFLFMILAGLAFIVCAGCQTMTEVLAAAAPFISETVANSLAASLSDAINQAAPGNPMGAADVQVFSDTLVGAFNGALKASHESQMAQIKAGQDVNFWTTLLASAGGGLQGGGLAGIVSHVKNKKLVMSQPIVTD